MTSNGKRFSRAKDLVDSHVEYEPKLAIELVKKVATAKFDETVELHLRTGADPRHADQQVRGVTVLPNGVGKSVRIAVFAQGEAVGIAEQAGADFAGSDDLVKKVEGGWSDFDVSIATPDMMGKVGRLGRILGRKGLMPNPKTGTVVQVEGIAKAVEEAKKGRVEYKLDRSSIIHVPIGKAGFEESQLFDNLAALMGDIVRSRPNGLKGQFIHSAYLTSTMGPSIKLSVAGVMSMDVE